MTSPPAIADIAITLAVTRDPLVSPMWGYSDLLFMESASQSGLQHVLCCLSLRGSCCSKSRVGKFAHLVFTMLLPGGLREQTIIAHVLLAVKKPVHDDVD